MTHQAHGLGLSEAEGHGERSPTMTRDELIALAREKAAAHQLFPELVCAVCEQESAWNPWAIRYEPGFYQRYVAPMLVAGQLHDETEARARAFSYGLMQVMGQVARERGFNGRFLAELCDPAVGLEIGCHVLEAKLAAAEGNLTRALLLWNGGANPSYPAEVVARCEKYRSR
jgi:soluble lytic murein transglycosylase-like protein